MTTTTQQTSLGKQARLGLYFLKEAISEVLFNVKDDRLLQPEDIRKQLGITKTDEPFDRSNTLIFDILFLLKSDGHVEIITEEGSGWRITEKGASLKRQKRNL